MRYRVAVEDIEPGHWVVWALDMPGCTSDAPTREEAIAQTPSRIEHFIAWSAGRRSARQAEPIAIEIEEEFASFFDR